MGSGKIGKLYVKRIVRSDGEVIVCSTVGTVHLY